MGVAKVLVDRYGNIIGVANVDGNWRLLTEATISGLVGLDPSNTGGLALEDTLQQVSLETTTSGIRVAVESLDTKDFATETTLAAVETTLDAIKDTDGIKKIVDSLPSGTNHLGSIAVDDSVLPDGAATETTLAGVKTTLDSIKDTDGVKQIQDPLPSGSNVLGRVRLKDPSEDYDLGDTTHPVRVDPVGTTTQPVQIVNDEGTPVDTVQDSDEDVYRLRTQSILVHTDDKVATRNQGSFPEVNVGSEAIESILRLIYMEMKHLRMIMAYGTGINFTEEMDE